MNQDRDLDYVQIIRTRDREKMYKYKLIKKIVEDLDSYLDENKIDNETMLLRHIDYLFDKHNPELIRYFNLFGGKKFNSQINIYDIEDWTFYYKRKNRLYNDNGIWNFSLYKR